MQVYDVKKLESIRKKLKASKETISVAESVTTGLVQFALGQAEFASEFYQGGITAYNLGQKYRHLKVEPIFAQACDCVSSQVAKEMAINVCELFNSRWGLSITGYATPTPESGNKIFAFYAIAHKGRVIAAAKISSRKKDPYEVQVEFARTILDKLLQKLG